jgi:hypothetical protein
MNQRSSTALTTTSGTDTSLSAYGEQVPPIPIGEGEPGAAFVLISRALPYAYLLFITGLGWRLYGGAPGGSNLTAAFILLLAPPGAALFLLPFISLPSFVVRALRRRKPALGGGALGGSRQLALAPAQRRYTAQLPQGPVRPSNP